MYVKQFSRDFQNSPTYSAPKTILTHGKKLRIEMGHCIDSACILSDDFVVVVVVVVVGLSF